MTYLVFNGEEPIVEAALGAGSTKDLQAFHFVKALHRKRAFSLETVQRPKHPARQYHRNICCRI
jgi:hypothetical protein